MAIPLNIQEVLKTAGVVEDEASKPISVSVIIDDTAPDDSVSFIRGEFASAGAGTRVTVGYMESGATANAEDDMVVIIAGTSEKVGSTAAAAREMGIPTMVATTMPKLVEDMAAAEGYPIPQGDIVAPIKKEKNWSKIAKLLNKGAEDTEDAPSDEISEPIPLTGDNPHIMNVRMGDWVIAACSDRKLAFAKSFPFVRRPLAEDCVGATSVQNLGVGLVPIIPGADMPVMTLNQAKMLMQIATAYGEPMDAGRVKELVALVAGAFAFRSIARSVAKAVPFAGWIVSGVVGFTGTEAMGKAAIEYFEAGGNLAGVGSVIQKASTTTAGAAKAALTSPAGKTVVDAVKAGTGKVVSSMKESSAS